MEKDWWEEKKQKYKKIKSEIEKIIEEINKSDVITLGRIKYLFALIEICDENFYYSFYYDDKKNWIKFLKSRRLYSKFQKFRKSDDYELAKKLWKEGKPLSEVFDDPQAVCTRCGRILTNPISRAIGMGPVCRCKAGK